MTDKRDANEGTKDDRRKDDDPKLRVDTIEDLDVPSEDADVLQGASGHIICINRVQGA